MREMKVHKKGSRRMWYDFRIRLWTLEDIADTDFVVFDYTPCKLVAEHWLETGKFKFFAR